MQTPVRPLGEKKNILLLFNVLMTKERLMECYATTDLIGNAIHSRPYIVNVWQ